MVKEIVRNRNNNFKAIISYICEECGEIYEAEDIAFKCEWKEKMARIERAKMATTEGKRLEIELEEMKREDEEALRDEIDEVKREAGNKVNLGVKRLWGRILLPRDNKKRGKQKYSWK